MKTRITWGLLGYLESSVADISNDKFFQSIKHKCQENESYMICDDDDDEEEKRVYIIR